MTTQHNALRLADRLSGHGGLTFVEMHAAAAELRRLHNQKAMLLDALRIIAALITNPEARQKALDAVDAVEGKA